MSHIFTLEEDVSDGTFQKFSARPGGGTDSDRAWISLKRIPIGPKFDLNDSYRAALKNLHFPMSQFSI